MEPEADKHWARDSELVENFVLNRVTGPRHHDLAKHLQACGECRAIVEKEQVLVEGLRRYGREELKSRLKQRVSTPAARSIPWPHLLSAAAVVVIVVGLGIYEHWFVPAQTDVVETTPEPSPMADAREAERGEAGAGVREAPVGEADRVAVPQTGGRDRSLSRPEDIAAPAARERGCAKIQTDEEAAKSRRPDEGMGERSKKDLLDRTADRLRAEKVWVDGVLLEEPSQADRTGPSGAVRQMRKGEPALAESQLKTPTSQSFVVVHKDARQKIKLMQQPFAQLPAEQKIKEKDSYTNRIPTLLEWTASGLNITIYSDDLTPIGQNVTVAPVAEDSLVVGIGEMKIGYRVPGGWAQQRKSAKTGK